MKTVVLFKYDDVARRVMTRLDGAVRVHDRAGLLSEIVDADCLVLANGGLHLHFVDRAVLDAAASLRFIQMYGVSTDSLDLDAATTRGIIVSNVPRENSGSVSEVAFLLLLGLAKNQPMWPGVIAERRLGSPYGTELFGKTVCIVGFGQIGRLIAAQARGFGMRVIGVNRKPHTTEVTEFGGIAFGLSDLPTALGQADFTVLAMPLGTSTHHMVDAAVIASMKRGSRLINIARGGVVVRRDVEAALTEGHLGGYATDVWWDEPADPDDPLLSRQDVILSPHIGGSSEEAVARAIEIVAANVARFRAGAMPEFTVNGGELT